jgi:hypothetical protein
VNWLPALQTASVTALPVRIFGKESKAGLKGEIDAGFVLKADANGVIAPGIEDFHAIHLLAFDLFQTIDAATGVAADGGLALSGFGIAKRRREVLPPFTLAG